MVPWYLSIVLFVSSFCNSIVCQDNLQTYIVHLDNSIPNISSNSQNLEAIYTSFLPQHKSQLPRLVHVYRNTITGFAANLSPDEVTEMAKLDGFLHARPEAVYSMHTTHSPNFLGLFQNHGPWRATNYGKGVIIGVLDGGITPGHPSFDDEGVPLPPPRWKGKCELEHGCNNKVIGARNFVRRSLGWSPVDIDGHGTHTASTAAGNFVPGASIFGQANGTAAGLAPLAHLAIYRVCGKDSCHEGDVLAAIDTAIEDGVDILSLSIGSDPVPFYASANAVASFQAHRKGIFFSASGDNSGPARFSVTNGAPWMLTVGASTIDRVVMATAVLGNGMEYKGQSLNQVRNFSSTMRPLIYPGSRGNKAAKWCRAGSLNRTEIQGKIVLCVRGGNVTRIGKGKTVKDAGGAGMIFMNDVVNAYSTVADPHVLPATHISHAAGERVLAYINSTSEPIATIAFEGTEIGANTAPTVASFSSRGPNLASPGILKPDIIGPGVSILAAWYKSVDNYKNEVAPFNMLSGTSMSCPHLSGIAALIKSAHPDWSPAMIKSAIMTTADQTDNHNNPIVTEQHQPADVFAIGAGHVNPPRALDPGLVYDTEYHDYISYLCLLYTETQVQVIANEKIDCSKPEYRNVLDEAQLNCPSITLRLGCGVKTYSRTVMNVGDSTSMYLVRIERVPGVTVRVEPEILRFQRIKEKKTYVVTFSREDLGVNDSYVQGSVSWVSSKHVVRIPVSVHLDNVV